MPFEELRDCSLLHLSLGDGQNHVDERPVGYLRLDAVEFQECQHRSRTDTFIPINERMVLHQVAEIGRGHFEAITMEVVFSKSGLLCDR